MAYGVSLYFDHFTGECMDGWATTLPIGIYRDKQIAEFVGKVMKNAYSSISYGKFTSQIKFIESQSVTEKLEKEDYAALLHSANAEELESRSFYNASVSDEEETAFKVMAMTQVVGFYNQQTAQEALEFLTVVNGTAAPFSIIQEGVHTVTTKLGKREYLHLLDVFRQAVVKTNEAAASDEKACIICKDKPKTVLLLPCRHLAFCLECVANLQNCAVCRTLIAGRLTVIES